MSTAQSSTRENYRDLIQENLGKEQTVTDWLELTQDRITAFGGVTNDFDPHHIDPEQGEKGPFKRIAAQGFLTLSLLTYFATQLPNNDMPVKGNVNYGLNRARFIKPAFVGDSLRAKFKLVDMKDKPGIGVVTTLDVEIESKETGDIVMVAQWLALLIF